MRITKHISILLISLLCIISCSKRNLECGATDLSNGGAISIKIEHNTTKAATKSIPVPTIDDFNVNITSTEADNNGDFQEFYSSLYSDMPSFVLLPQGDYKLTTVWGPNQPFSTENPTYIAQEQVAITTGNHTSVSMVAKMKGYAVGVFYSDDVFSNFTELYIEAQQADQTHRFAIGSSQIAYFAPGSVTLVLKGTTTTGQQYSTIIKEISSAGQEYYMLTLNIRPAGHSFEVNVETNIENLDIKSETDKDLYPEMPEISVGAMEFVEPVVGASQNGLSTINARSAILIEDVEISFTTANIEAYGLTQNRVYKLSDDDDVTALKAVGITVPQQVVGVNSALINLGGLNDKLLTENCLYTEFGVNVKVYDQAITDPAKKVKSRDFNIKLAPPQFSLEASPAKWAWTKSIDLKDVEVTVGNEDNLKASQYFAYQVSTDGGTTWSNATVANNSITGLSNGTTYLVRAKYRDIVTTPFSMTTETPRQIPNNTFGTYYEVGRKGTMGSNQPCYFFFANGAPAEDKWWDTRNDKTTSEGSGYMYVRYSGSRPLGSGIELVTCGWGSGNTAAGGSSIINNIWAGVAFLGSWNGSTEVHGKDFDARPTAMSFNYTYAPYDSFDDKYVAQIWLENRTGDIVTRLAYGESSEGDAVGSWTNKTVQLQYSDTLLPITHLCVFFKSGVNEGKKDYVSKPPYTSNWFNPVSDPSRGSVFCVNNVTLVYDK